MSPTPIHAPSGLRRFVCQVGFDAEGRVRPAWRAMLFLGLGFVLLALVGGALDGLGLERGSALRTVVAYAAACLLLLLETWFLLVVFDRRSFRTLGLWFYPGWAGEGLRGAALGGGLVVGVVGLAVVFRGIGYQGILPEAAQALAGVPRVAGVVLLAAAFEELAFRGYAFQRLVEGLGEWGGVAVFSVLFGMVHLGNPAATPFTAANTILAGALLSVAYLKTRALWMPLGLHFAWNFLMGPILSLPVSGVSIGQPIFAVKVGEPGWLSGGAYGPEGSVVLTVVCGLAIAALARSRRFAPSSAMARLIKTRLPEASDALQ